MVIRLDVQEHTKVVTLVPALKRRGSNKGVASLCVGGSEVTVVALEMIS